MDIGEGCLFFWYHVNLWLIWRNCLWRKSCLPAGHGVRPASASVTALAADTDSSTPEAGFTEDKASSEEVIPEISIIDLETKYGDVFLVMSSQTKKLFQ